MQVSVGVTVNVRVSVGVKVIEPVISVFVTVHVGDQHSTSASTLFDAMGGDPALYSINAWFDSVELHVFAVPYHVKEPDVREAAPMLQFTTPPACVQPPPGLPP